MYGQGLEYAVGNTLPLQFLNSHSEATLKCAEIVSSSEKGAKQASLFGTIKDYTARDYVMAPFASYEDVLLDTSMATAAERMGMDVAQFLEILDPSSNYKVGGDLHNMTAAERQFYRFGLTKMPSKSHLPAYDPSLQFAVAHTSSNNVLEPMFTKLALFYTPVEDTEYDPNLLLSSTRTQVEDSIRIQRIEDSLLPYRTLQILSGNTPPRGFRLSMQGYTSSMIEHGLSFAWSREFANSVPFSFFKLALKRASTSEHVALFHHILDFIVSGNVAYGKASGVPSLKASVLDSEGSLAAGATSWIANLFMLNTLHPYKTDFLIMNPNTYVMYTQAAVPGVVALQEVRDILGSVTKIGGTARVTGASRFYDAQPEVLVVPSWMLADDKIVYLNKEHSVIRVIRQKTDTVDLDFDIHNAMWTQIWRLQEGLVPLPYMNTATQVMDLTL